MGQQGAQFGGAQRFVQQGETGLADAQDGVGCGVAGDQDGRNVVAEFLPQADDDLDAVDVVGQAVVRHDGVGRAVKTGEPVFGFVGAVGGDQVDLPGGGRGGRAARGGAGGGRRRRRRGGGGG